MANFSIVFVSMIIVLYFVCAYIGWRMYRRQRPTKSPAAAASTQISQMTELSPEELDAHRTRINEAQKSYVQQWQHLYGKKDDV